MNDEQNEAKARLKAAIDSLNGALGLAAEAGLKVELKELRSHTIGRSLDALRVSLHLTPIESTETI